MMKCDVRTMVKASLGLGVIIGVAYATVPVAREWIATSTPFLFFLICPLMMIFMMKGMQSCDKAQKIDADKTPTAPVLGHAPLKD